MSGGEADFSVTLLCVGVCLSWIWYMESPLIARQSCG